jgi:predicted nucleotidyltransferase
MLNLRSKLRRDLLTYCFTNPDASHHLRELARILDADPANLSRELASLQRQGLFVSQTQGRQKYFQLDRGYPLFHEYRRIVRKTLGVAHAIREALAPLSGIREAYLYGSFARGQADASSDIDLLLIGRPDPTELETTIARLERRLGREINYTLLSPKEFKARRTSRDPFLQDLWRHERISLIAPHEKASPPAG